MRNERYCGDVLARKTWTPDFHDHKSVKNRNKKNKYYQPAHHDAIITRAQWNAAQRILNSHRYRHTGAYIPMRVIDIGALRGFISVNRSWAGHEEDEYYRVSRIAMGLEEGELRADLENEHLPDAGRRLVGMTDDNGIQRISRELSDMEKRVKAQLEGKTMEEYEQENAPPVKKGFQVVGAGMFSQAFEPVVRISSRFISFNAKCISKLNTMFEDDEGHMLKRCQYVELLFNPVERILCRDNHILAMNMDTEKLAAWIRDVVNVNGLGAIVFIWDEFSEYFKNCQNSLTGFQTLVEVSETSPFYFVIVTHESDGIIANASDRSKISNRFIEPRVHIELPDNMAFQLMAQAMKQTDDPMMLKE